MSWDHTWGNIHNGDATEGWATQSLYDIETAKAMLDTGRYLYVLFCCQQAVEKMLRALMARTKNCHPVFTIS
jgi:HEPN domain-containing protein